MTNVSASLSWCTADRSMTREQLGALPLWAWFGGLLGAFYVGTATFVGPSNIPRSDRSNILPMA